MEQKIKERKNKKNREGITLIALVITIIVLLILAGITLNLVLGEHGIFTMAKEGKVKYGISQYIEEVELARGEVAIEKEGKVTIDDLIQKIKENKIVPEENITKLNEETAKMETVEKYIIIVTAQSTEYIGNVEEGKLSISEPTWNSAEHTASVEISKIGSNSLEIQYQVNGIDDENWKTGETVEELQHNDIVYARLWNGNKGEGITIRTIKDTKKPTDATIELSAKEAGINANVVATVTLKDGQTGVNVLESKWSYSDKQDELGEEPSQYENAFTDNPQLLSLKKETVGTYYLHILTQDNVGNRKETISEAIEVKQLVTNISLNEESLTIEKGKTAILTATILPENAENKEIEWSSSNETVASVANGVVTAKTAGKATITAKTKDGSNIEASCAVTVTMTVSNLATGNYVSYNSGSNGTILCRVLYPASSAYGFQIISDKNVKNVTLGVDGSTPNTSHWKNAIKTLNTQASAYLNSTYAESARCVGSVPNNPNTGATNASQDTYYTTDFNAMKALNIQTSRCRILVSISLL